MDRPPIVNELAIGAYDGEYYRARVVKVSGDKIEINFIDFGDKKECKYTEIFPVNDEIMKVRHLYNACLNLRSSP